MGSSQLSFLVLVVTVKRYENKEIRIKQFYGF